MSNHCSVCGLYVLCDSASGKWVCLKCGSASAPLKALSLTQPWATLVAIGAKRIETRSWSTNYRGPLLIHASAGFPGDCRALCRESPFVEALIRAGFNAAGDLPRGAIVAYTRLVDVVKVDEIAITPIERAFGNYSRGRYGWKFGAGSTARLAVPVPCKGALGLWNVPADVARAVRLTAVAS